MGLAGRKTKQRIGADPRNLSWADDASKFGSTYLAKFGWDSSKGLGVTGDGRTTHVKAQQKLDMLGIGAAHMHDPSGIAWKQNRDFEDLLKRLNEQTNGEGDGEEEEKTKVEVFLSAVAVSEDGVESGKDKNKKRKKDKDDQEGKKSKRKRKDKDDTEHKTKNRKNSADEEESNVSTSEALQQVTQPVIPRHRAHRARAIAAKNMLSSSATALSEILGIAPMPSSLVTPSGSATPQGQLTTVDDGDVGEKITTSTKSVADYFKEKLMSKSSGQSESMTPNTPEDAYDTPRGGLGSSQFKMDSGETTSNDGMSKFASLMSSTFLAAASSAASALSIPEDAPKNQERREKAEIDDGDHSRKQKKRDKKDKKKQDKGTKDDGSELLEEQARKEKKRRVTLHT